jgi:hypothetical protein
MSDNRRVYGTILTNLRQLYPQSAKGNVVRQLITSAVTITGIVQSESCQLPSIARKVPAEAKADSRIKQYSRWNQNERIDYCSYYLSLVLELLQYLASNTELIFVIDGSVVGHQWIALMVSSIFRKRSLPIT